VQIAQVGDGQPIKLFRESSERNLDSLDKRPLSLNQGRFCRQARQTCAAKRDGKA